MKFSRQLEPMETTSQGYFPDRLLFPSPTLFSLLSMEDYIFKSPCSSLHENNRTREILRKYSIKNSRDEEIWQEEENILEWGRRCIWWLVCENSNNKSFDVRLIFRRLNGDRYPSISSRVKNKISNDLNNSNKTVGRNAIIPKPTSDMWHLTFTLVWRGTRCARFPHLRKYSFALPLLGAQKKPICPARQRSPTFKITEQKRNEFLPTIGET